MGEDEKRLVHPGEKFKLAMWIIPFINEAFHHSNAFYGVAAELSERGSSPFGRVAHHLLDGLFHTVFYYNVCCSYKREWLSLFETIMFFALRMATEQLPFGGQEYNLKYHQEESERSAELWKTYIPNENMMGLNIIGATLWTYLIAVLIMFVFFAGWRNVLNQWKLLIVQLVVVIIFVFLPAGEYLFCGSNPTDRKILLLHLSHGADYFVWNTALLSWLVYGCHIHEVDISPEPEKEIGGSSSKFEEGDLDLELSSLDHTETDEVFTLSGKKKRSPDVSFRKAQPYFK